jgi:hypothetical protein
VVDRTRRDDRVERPGRVGWPAGPLEVGLNVAGAISEAREALLAGRDHRRVHVEADHARPGKRFEQHFGERAVAGANVGEGQVSVALERQDAREQAESLALVGVRLILPRQPVRCVVCVSPAIVVHRIPRHGCALRHGSAARPLVPTAAHCAPGR